MKIVTIGEIMLRLTPFGYGRFVQAGSFEAHYGGAEANVAAALACWGEKAVFVSKVPAHEIGQAAINSLRALGVDTRYILRGGDRLGIYYAERGADRRESKVIYDRTGSAFACSEGEEYDWESIFDSVDWLHITGILPALGERAEEMALFACKAAKDRGATVSCDVNYRSKLWDRERAAKAMEKLFRYVDVCIVNENQADELFGVSGKNAMRMLAERYSFSCVAFTYRRTKDALHNAIWGSLYAGGKTAESRVYEMEMIDRIGGGDAFAAGLIYAFGHGYDPQKVVDFAEAASCLKHSVEGDMCIVSPEEIFALRDGVGGGIKR